MIRTCFKCGAEFPKDGKCLLCPTCRAKGKGKKKSFWNPPTNAPLSFRELQIAALVHQDLENKEIAAKLGLTIGTVNQYMHHRIMPKLRDHYKLTVNSRVGVALFYERNHYSGRRAVA